MRMFVAPLAFAMGACSLDFNMGGRQDATPEADVDASPDGSQQDAGASPNPCSSAGHILCDDFENGLDLGRWKLNESSGSTLGLKPREDGGQMLVATLPDGSLAKEAYLSWETNSEQGMRVSFDVRITDPKWSASDNNFAIVQLEFISNNEPLSIDVYVKPEGSAAKAGLTYEYLDAGKSTLGFTDTKAFPFGVWRRVSMEGDFGNDARGAFLTVGDANVLAATFSAREGKPTLRLGLFRPNGRTPPLRVDIDNVVVDAL